MPKTQAETLTVHGITLTIAQWANQYNLKSAALHSRLQRRKKGTPYTDLEVIVGKGGVALPPKQELDHEDPLLLRALDETVHRNMNRIYKDVAIIAKKRLASLLNDDEFARQSLSEMQDTKPLSPYGIQGSDYYVPALGTTIGDAMTYLEIKEVIRMVKETPPEEVNISDPLWLELCFSLIISERTPTPPTDTSTD